MAGNWGYLLFLQEIMAEDWVLFCMIMFPVVQAMFENF